MMKTLASAALPALLYLGLTLVHADAGLTFLSGQLVTRSAFGWALAYLLAYGCFVLITPTLVLSLVLEPLIRALLRMYRGARVTGADE